MTAKSPLERSATSPSASAPNGMRPQYRSVNSEVTLPRSRAGDSDWTSDRLDDPVDRKTALRHADGDRRNGESSPTPDADQPGADEKHPDEDRSAMADAAHEWFRRQPGEEAADPATDVHQADRPRDSLRGRG